MSCEYTRILRLQVVAASKGLLFQLSMFVMRVWHVYVVHIVQSLVKENNIFFIEKIY